METSVVNITKDKCDVYIGRGHGGIWGNPFILNRHGNRNEVIAKHRSYLIDQFLSGDRSWDQIKDLHGKILGCYCSPRKCHGDTLRYFADMAVKFKTEDEFLEFVRKENGGTDKRPPQIRLKQARVNRASLKKKLDNAHVLYHRATNGELAMDSRVYEALIQHAEESLSQCEKEIKALETEIEDLPSQPKPRSKRVASTQSTTQPNKETEEMSNKNNAAQLSVEEIVELATQSALAAVKTFQESQVKDTSVTQTMAPPPSEWSYETSRPSRRGRTYVTVTRGNETVSNTPSEHWHEGIFHAAQMDNIVPPPNGGAGRISFNTEILVDGRYVGKIHATPPPTNCPTLLQAMLDKFANVPRHQTGESPDVPVNELHEHKNYHFPKPEATTIENITAEEEDDEVHTMSSGSNGKMSNAELTDMIKDLEADGLTRKEIKSILNDDYGQTVSIQRIGKLANS